jgi:hypothetical protein
MAMQDPENQPARISQGTCDNRCVLRVRTRELSVDPSSATWFLECHRVGGKINLTRERYVVGRRAREPQGCKELGDLALLYDRIVGGALTKLAWVGNL